MRGAHVHSKAAPRQLRHSLQGACTRVVCVRYGLLVPVIMHYVYDLVWMSVPLFMPQSPTFQDRLGQLTVILAGALPLLIPAVLRIDASGTGAPDDGMEALRNGTWPAQPKPSSRPTSVTRLSVAPGSPPTKRVASTLRVVSVLAFGVLLVCSASRKPDVPAVAMSRTAAILRASDAIGTYPGPWPTIRVWWWGPGVERGATIASPHVP